MKQPVVLRNWRVLVTESGDGQGGQVYRLMGNVYGHPKFKKGDYILSSPIQQILDRNYYKLAYTKNSAYMVYPGEVDAGVLETDSRHYDILQTGLKQYTACQ